MKRLTKTYKDGTHGVSDEWEDRENSYAFKDALIESVGQYEDLELTPKLIRERDHLYAEKESMATYQQFIKENNKQTLAQVFTDVRYKKSNNEHFSAVLLNTLKNQGFL